MIDFEKTLEPDSIAQRVSQGLTRSGVQLSASQIQAVAAAIAPILKDTRAALQDLDYRLQVAEHAPMEYLGVFEPTRGYRRGAFVTMNGNVWACLKTTTQRPGDSPDWVLAVRAGRDGRDSR